MLRWVGAAPRTRKATVSGFRSPPGAILENMGVRKTGFVFQTESGRPCYDMDRAMREISEALSLRPTVRPHDLRRTHGTTITRLQFGRDAMNRIQNHAEGGIADVYDQYKYEAENIKIQEAVAAEFLRLITDERAAIPGAAGVDLTRSDTMAPDAPFLPLGKAGPVPRLESTNPVPTRRSSKPKFLFSVTWKASRINDLG